MPSLSRFSNAGSGLQVTLCRMPRNRLGLAACNASRTGATLAPSFKSAWPMMAAAALLMNSDGQSVSLRLLCPYDGK
jgi:hypothetical protein